MKNLSFWVVLAFPFHIFGQKEAEKVVFFEPMFVYSGTSEWLQFRIPTDNYHQVIIHEQASANLGFCVSWFRKKTFWQKEVSLIRLDFLKKNDLDNFSPDPNPHLGVQPNGGSGIKNFQIRMRFGFVRRIPKKQSRAAFLIGAGAQGYAFSSNILPVTSQSFPSKIWESGTLIDSKTAFSIKITSKTSFQTGFLWPLLMFKKAAIQIENPNLTFAEQHQENTWAKLGNIDRAIFHIGVAIQLF